MHHPAPIARISLSPHWSLTRDGDPLGLDLHARHYSCRQYRDGRTRTFFVGPGEKLVLLSREGNAVLTWRRFYSQDHQEGVNCSLFRNEGTILSSVLIREAMQIARCRWPDVRLYTYVDPRTVRSTNPGFCFLQAGWRRCGKTQRGLFILEARSSPDSQSVNPFPCGKVFKRNSSPD